MTGVFFASVDDAAAVFASRRDLLAAMRGRGAVLRRGMARSFRSVPFASSLCAMLTVLSPSFRFCCFSYLNRGKNSGGVQYFFQKLRF
jgi:hypothetical protein